MDMGPMHMSRTVKSLRALIVDVYFSRGLIDVKQVVVNVV